MAGILGLPFPNGLIPQAPFHTESLCVTKVVHNGDDDNGNNNDDNNNNSKRNENDGDENGHWELKRTHVVEQRVSNLAQGLLTLGTMTGPLLVVLHLIPQGVLAGLFFIMGYQALEGNGITAKILFLLQDRRLATAITTPSSPPFTRVQRRAAIWGFVAIELVGFGATFAITQTVAAVGFPCFIIALIPVRALLLPRIFTPQELNLLDEPTASDFIMENVGGGMRGDAVDEEEEGGSSSSPGEETSERSQSRDNKRGGGGGILFRDGGNNDMTEEELAELGENKSVKQLSIPDSLSGPRRRNSVVVRDED